MRSAFETRPRARGCVVGLGLGRFAFVGAGVAVVLCARVALSAPEGAKVVAGTAAFSQNGHSTTITVSDNAIINYSKFNIAGNEAVHFVQPGASSRVLNRITGDAPTRIDGTLTANGIVYFANPAGVFFGRGAVVNVGGIYAAAGQITNKDFLANVNRFSDVRGDVVNSGSIVVNNAGVAALIGSRVSNFGAISADKGVIALVSGNDVVLSRQGDPMSVRVSVGSSGENANANPPPAPSLGEGERHPRFRVVAGDMTSLAIRNSGSVRAADVVMEARGRGGVEVGGRVDVAGQGAGGAGGTVRITGQDVRVAGATIDASGTRGGEIDIGGEIHGGGSLRTASTTNVSADSVLDARGQSGDGGTIAVWSNQRTSFSGTARADGTGNGGFVETSSKQVLDVGGARVSASGGAQGRPGEWLLDPTDLTVDATLASAIDAALDANTDVTLDTSSASSDLGNLTVSSAILKSMSPNGVVPTLTMHADNNITLNANVTSTAGAMNVVLQATGNVLLSGGAVATNGGTFSSTGAFFSNSGGGTISTSGGDITLNIAGTTAINDAISTGGSSGSVSITTQSIGVGGIVTGHSITVLPASGVTQIALGNVVGLNMLQSELLSFNTPTLTIGAAGGSQAVVLGTGSATTLDLSSASYDLTVRGDSFTMSSGFVPPSGHTFSVQMSNGIDVSGMISAAASAGVSLASSGGDVHVANHVLTAGGNFLSTGRDFLLDSGFTIGTGAGSLTLTHTRDVTINGSLTTSNADVVASGATFTSGSNGTVSTSGGDVSLDFTGQVTVGALINASTASTSSITVTASDVALNAATSLRAGAGGIALMPTNAGSPAVTEVRVNGSEGAGIFNVSASDLNSVVTPGVVTVGRAGSLPVNIGLAGNSDLQTSGNSLSIIGGAITFNDSIQLASNRILVLNGSSVTDAHAGADAVFGASATASAAGTVILTATGDASFGTNAQTLGGGSTAHNLTIDEVGAMSFGASGDSAPVLVLGNLSLTSGSASGAGGAITQNVPVQVTGTTFLQTFNDSGAAITLSDANNSFGGAVTALATGLDGTTPTNGAISLRSGGAIVLDTVVTGSSGSFDAAGSISQASTASATRILNIGTASSFLTRSSGAGAGITIANNNNLFGGNLSASSRDLAGSALKGGGLVIRGTGLINLGTVGTTSSVNIAANGGAGAIVATGDITGGTLIAIVGPVGVTINGGTTASNTAGGTISLSASGGTVSVAGAVSTAGVVNISGSAADISGSVQSTGNTLGVTTDNALTVTGSATATGRVTLTTGDIVLGGAVGNRVTSSTSDVILQPKASNAGVAINDSGAGITYQLTDAELGKVSAGSGTVYIGRDGQTGPTAIGGSGAVDLSGTSYDLVLRGGSVTFKDNLTLADDHQLSVLLSGGSVSQTGVSASNVTVGGTAGKLLISAPGSIDLKTGVAELAVQSTSASSSDSVSVRNSGGAGLTLTTLSAKSNPTGSTTSVTGLSGPGDLTLTTDGALMLSQPIVSGTSSSRGTVVVTADGSISVPASMSAIITANRLDITSTTGSVGNGQTVYTSLGSLSGLGKLFASGQTGLDINNTGDLQDGSLNAPAGTAKLVTDGSFAALTGTWLGVKFDVTTGTASDGTLELGQNVTSTGSAGSTFAIGNGGVFKVDSGATVSTSGFPLSISASDVMLAGNVSGGTVAISPPTAGSQIWIGDVSGAPGGAMRIDSSELENIAATTLTLGDTNTGLVHAASVSLGAGNVDTLALVATGTNGQAVFAGAASTFKSLSASAKDGIVVGADLSTTVGDLALDGDADRASQTSDAIQISGGVTLASAHDLSLRAASGGISDSGALTLDAANDVVVRSALTVGGALAINADSDSSGAGSFVLAPVAATPADASVASITATGGLSMTAADVMIDGDISTGSAAVAIERSTTGTVQFGDYSDTAGALTLDLDEYEHLTAGGFTLGGVKTANLNVNGVGNEHIAGTTTLEALASGGELAFETASSAFHTLLAKADTLVDVRSAVSTDAGSVTVDGGANVGGVNDGSIQLGADVSSMTQATFDSPVILTAPMVTVGGSGVGGNVTFASTVVSDGTPRSLTVISGIGTNSGVTTFAGDVGGAAGAGGAGQRLLRLNVQNDAVVAGDVRTTGRVDFDAVSMTGGASQTIESGDALLFHSTAKLHGLVHGNTAIFYGAVTLNGADTTIFVDSSTVMQFLSTIDADAGTSDPNLTLAFGERGTGYDSNTATSPSFISAVQFEGDVGVNKALGNLYLDYKPVSDSVSAAFDGRALPAALATIIGVGNRTIDVDGTFRMGVGEKFTSYGSLTINAGGSAWVGDLNSVGDLTVTSPSINIIRRDSGKLWGYDTASFVDLNNGQNQLTASPHLVLSDENVNNTPTGVDYVTGGAINFNTSNLSLVGSGPNPRFATLDGTGGGTGTVFQGFTFQQFGVVSRELVSNPPVTGGQQFGASTLDLNARGPSATDPATGLASAIPRDARVDVVGQEPTIDPATKEDLKKIGVNPRDPSLGELVELLAGTAMFVDVPSAQGGSARQLKAADFQTVVNRLPLIATQQVVGMYRNLFTEPVYDENGKAKVNLETGRPEIKDRSSVIKAAIEHSVRAYLAAGQDKSKTPKKFDPYEFHDYVEASTDPEDATTALYLDELRELFGKLKALGLTSAEISRVRTNLLNRIRPRSIQNTEQMEQVVEGRPVQMQS